MKTLGTSGSLGVIGLVMLLASCATPAHKPLPHTGDLLRDGQTYIEQGPPKDRVLWQYRTAASAMRRGDFALAKRLLDDAILRIGGILTDDKSARKARSLFQEEARKIFIGEPYERVMAYYYRGILYWMDGEPDNARACFRSGELIDSDTENKTYSSDYALLDYLDGLATAKLKGDGSDALKRARELSKLEAPPDYDPSANVLVFAEFGHCPTKYATGQYGEQLRFREGRSNVRTAALTVGGQRLRLRPYDDLNFQATTRGGRVMDHVLANKAMFKSTTDTLGDAAIVSGAILAGHQGHRSNSDEVGAGLLAFGLLSKVISAATTPVADTRCWDNLPQYLGFAALRLPPGQHAATVEFQDAVGRPISSLTKSITILVPAVDRDTVVFISDKQ